MLILPPGHAGATPRYRLSGRERWMIGGVLGALVAIALAIVISLVSNGPTSGRGCVYATIPGPVGAQEISRCGAAARELCRSVGAPGGYSGESARTIAGECRKAGLPVGA